MKSRQPGFTIIELMVTLLVVAILVAAAIPSFREFTRNNRVIAAQNDLVTAMSLARSEAVKQSRAVTVCASADNATCSGDTNWATGWIVTVPGVGLVQAWPAPGGDITATATVSALNYQAIGTVAASGVFTLAWPNCSGPRKHEVTVLLVGSPQSVTKNCP
jgi:type IV fimbrial biogenesis protein FimT